MAAQLVIGRRAAPVLDQEQAQVLLGRPEILARIDRAQLRIGCYLLVEPVHQATERRLAANLLVQARWLGCHLTSVFGPRHRALPAGWLAPGRWPGPPGIPGVGRRL